MSETLRWMREAPLSPNGWLRCAKVICADGFKMSMQASHAHYCSPREDGLNDYDTIEIGFPSEKEELLMDYAEDGSNPTGTVYGWVPVEIVDKIIRKHGGLL